MRRKVRLRTMIGIFISQFFDSGGSPGTLPGGPPGATSQGLRIHAFSRWFYSVRNLVFRRIFRHIYRNFSPPAVIRGTSGGDIPSLLIHAFSWFGRHLNAVRYMVLGRVFAHISLFFASGGPPEALAGGLRACGAQHKLRATDAEP